MEDSKLGILTNLKISGYSVEEKTHQEKKHLVVPVTMIVEGVLAGSRGPLLHLAEDFGKFPASWDGIPIVINHPEKDGVAISANNVETIDTGLVGRVYNAFMDGSKLKAEAWLDPERLSVISPDTFSAIGLKQAIEVSVGVFTEEEKEPGTYGDIEYNAIARNHRPDHLALLPGGVGACSLKDGCGIRVNNKQLKKKGENDEMNILTQEQIGIYNQVKYIFRGITDNSTGGLKEKLENLRKLVDSLDKPSDQMGNNGVYNSLEEAYDTYLIYEQWMSGGGDDKCFKQGYQIDATGEATFIGDPIEVEKIVTYTPVIQQNQFTRVKINKNKKESMDCTLCVKAKVDTLITNAIFTENDRTELETLSEKVLDRMITPPTPAIEALSAEDKAALDFGKTQIKAQRDSKIASITANTAEGVWTPEVLASMSEDMLDRIVKTLPKNEEAPDYSMQAAGRSLQANAIGKVTPLYPAGVEVEGK